jgi:hypothetical protein
MPVVDFIEVRDDFIDLTSDEETVQQDNIATQPQATLLDRQAVFVVADEEKQDGQAAFVSAGDGSQEANESGNALVATTSPSVMEKVLLDMAQSQNCPSSPTSAPLASIFFNLPQFSSSLLCLSCKQSTSSMHCRNFLFKVNSDMLQARLVPLRRFCPLKLVTQSRMCLS